MPAGVRKKQTIIMVAAILWFLDNTDGQMDGQIDGWTLPSALSPFFVVDKKNSDKL